MLKNLNSKFFFFSLFVFVLFLTPLGIEIRAEDNSTDDVSKPSELRFAVWNIARLGGLDTLPRTENRNTSELKEIARILHQYDFITIIELYDERYLEKIRNFLGEIEKSGIKKVYGSHVSPMVGKQEKYAFLYDTSFIDIVPEKRGIYPHKKETFSESRKPYWATFEANEFDFSVIAVHLSAGNVKKKRKQVKALREVYQYVQEENNGENDVLLVGDFNLDTCDVDAFWNLMTLGEMTALFHRREHLSSLNAVKDRKLHDNIIFDRKYITDQEYHKGSCWVYELIYIPWKIRMLSINVSVTIKCSGRFLALVGMMIGMMIGIMAPMITKNLNPEYINQGHRLFIIHLQESFIILTHVVICEKTSFEISLDEVNDCYEPCSRF